MTHAVRRFRLETLYSNRGRYSTDIFKWRRVAVEDLDWVSREKPDVKNDMGAKPGQGI